MQHQTIAPETPRQIEAQLEHDREALMTSVDALWNRLSLDRLWTDGASLIKANAGPYTQALDAAVRANPMGLALTAVGLAWLILGRRNEDGNDAPGPVETKLDAERHLKNDGGHMSGLPSTDAEWMEEADRLRTRASKMMSQINTAVRDNKAPAAELAKSRSDVAASLTKDVRRIMARGLEGVTGTARDAAIAGRERAYMMRIAAAKVGGETVRDNPLVAGIALAAAGATVAALLPRSAFEDHILGAPRDRLVGETKRVLKEERQRVAQSVRHAAQALMADIAPASARSEVPEAEVMRKDVPSAAARYAPWDGTDQSK